MTKYSTLNPKLVNLQLSKLKLGIKNGAEVTAFTNGSSANIKFSKTQLSKVIESGEILDPISNIFGPLSPVRMLDLTENLYGKE